VSGQGLSAPQVGVESIGALTNRSGGRDGATSCSEPTGRLPRAASAFSHDSILIKGKRRLGNHP
jgi:hypothetical protein